MGPVKSGLNREVVFGYKVLYKLTTVHTSCISEVFLLLASAGN